MNSNREHGVTEAFVSLADSLVEPFDVVELLGGLTEECARLLDVASAGLLLADRFGVLHVVAASSEQTRSLPRFVAAATSRGFGSVHAIPMRIHDQMLGALGLFGATTGALNDEDLRLGQALAHVASVALVAGNVATSRNTLNQQLQTALDSRVFIEQAKGAVAQHAGLGMAEAFDLLRRDARQHGQKLSDVAQAVATRSLPIQEVAEGPQTLPARRQRPSARKAADG